MIYEFILINDCSTDHLCLKYIYKFIKDKNNWVIINHSQNRCLGEARNTGIKNSNGLYVLFVDSDDWIEENTIDKLYDFLLNNHVQEFLSFNYFLVKGSEIIKNDSNVFYFNSCKIFGTAIAWSKLYNKNFLLKNNIFFANLNLPNEDEYWFLLLLYFSKKPLYIENIFTIEIIVVQ